MKPRDIKHQLDELDSCIKTRELGRARSMARTMFTSILKSAYAQIRSQASAAIMRRLLELEIEIGGENGEFRHFDDEQMIDLFTRGDVAGQMETHMAPGPVLSAAVNFPVIARWCESGRQDDGPESAAPVRFVYAWLRLFAEEAAILDPDEEPAVNRIGCTKAPEAKPGMTPDAGQPYTEPVTGMNFVWVPESSFSMGDTFDEGVEDEKPVHRVRLSDFYMAACPVTQAQWNCLMPENPSNFVGDDHPVEQVTLSDVQIFIDRLNAASTSGMTFNLPSEAQWEYAARSGGKDELYAGGEDPEAVAWFADNSRGGTAPVANKMPNGLGLYDMSGNVWEWCRDLYHPDAYRRHSKNDPVCTSGDTDRVIRGGSWHLDAWSARCSRRFRFDPGLFGPALGFRVVMTKGG